MNATPDIEREVVAWFRAESPAAAPASLIADIESAVGRTSRRPRWLAAVGGLDGPRIPVFPGGRVQIAIVIALVAGIVGLLLVGSRPAVPAPYGPARSGMYVLSLAGDLVSISADGSRRTTLTSGDGVDSNPILSRDGTSIAFWSLPPGTNVAEFAVLGADGSDRRVVATTMLVGVDSGPRVTWSPDGSRLAFSDAAGAGGRIRVVRADGSGELRIGDSTLSAWDPAWSPDGGRIAFRGGRGAEQLGVAMVSPDGTDLRWLLLADDVDATTPVAWAPDGSRIAVSTCDAACQLHVVRVDGSGDTEIDAQAAAVGASWSPDGRRLAWLRVREGAAAGEYVIANPDGSDQVVYPHPAIPNRGGGYDGLGPIVQWTPDGRQLTGILGTGDGWTFNRLLLIDTADGHATVIDAPGLRSWDQQRLAP
jgi:TolB protein